ncbi:hypothetical protein CEUSTIGMA_g11021.t1 [Chlamydomonas eustigma]|uniref:AMP-dependent synthetase/ligase domain-containing protein n=1 Tax=Chlamydomonas eustigma TaxID=1157962 RepID=A0A250XKQ2_9CHLO|nr:hypothetical protein CEUSTIGMA_g11021.t1 [Chlamydomonas eustigma]|eukprot:GAX83596.1 hypothetical protein CEUSTIGMA_g11021.t1 [Chlamydomonas eustigma]
MSHPEPYISDVIECTRLAGTQDGALLDSLRALSCLYPSLSTDLQSKVWRFLIDNNVVHPGLSFPAHQSLAKVVFSCWPADVLGPHPLYIPTFEEASETNVWKFLMTKGSLLDDAAALGNVFKRVIQSRDVGGAWQLLHKLSRKDPESFWGTLLTEELSLPWHQTPHRMLQLPYNAGTDPDTCQWMPGGRLNIAQCALSGCRRAAARRSLAGNPSESVHRPLQNKGDALSDSFSPAIVYAEEGFPELLKTLSLGELREMSAHVACCLSCIIEPGDAVAIVMPMTMQAVIIYFGIVLAGCVVVSIADSFSASEISARLVISGAKLVMTQDVVVRGGKYLPMYSKVLEGAKAPPTIVVPSFSSSSSPEVDSNLYTRAIISRASSNGSDASTSASGSCLRVKAEVQLRRPCDMHYTTFMSLAPWKPHDGSQKGVPSWWQSTPPSPTTSCRTNCYNIINTSVVGTASSSSQNENNGEARGGDAGNATSTGRQSGSSCGLHKSRHEDLPWIVDSSADSNILFSSGTTGEPKAICWSHITPLRAWIDGWAHQDIQIGDVVCWPTSLGWMMGPWLLYATFLNGGTLALYHGAPLGPDFCRFVGAAGVNVLGLVPSIVKAWRASGCLEGIQWPHLKCISSTGEASAPEDYHWLMSKIRYKPIIEYCGGTEIGGGFLSCTMFQPQNPSCFSTPTLGTQLGLMLPDGTVSYHHQGSGQAPTQRAVTGELVLVPPLLGSSQRLLNRNHAEVYFKGMPVDSTYRTALRRHGDEMERLPNGYYRALGRCDDTMNLGGIKVSSVEIERAVLEGLPDVVADVAAVGVPTLGGGPEQLVLFIVQHGHGGNIEVLLETCQREVRKLLNPLFKVSRVILKSQLPRTASNKVIRRELRLELLNMKSPTTSTSSKL